MIRQIFGELWSMFVDDGALAAQVVALISVLGLMAWALSPVWVEVLLLPGCLIILAASVVRARPKPGPR